MKAFNREQDTIEEFDATNQKLYESAWKSQFLSGMMQPIMMFVGNLGYAAVALSGGLLAIRGTITIGDIQAFIQYVKSFTQPIQQIAQVINQVQSMAAASERVFEFLNEVRQIAPELEVAGIAVTKVDTRKNYFKQTMEILHQLENIHVFDNLIRVDSNIEWSQDNSVPVVEYRKSSRSAKEYTELAREVMDYVSR